MAEPEKVCANPLNEAKILTLDNGLQKGEQSLTSNQDTSEKPMLEDDNPIELNNSTQEKKDEKLRVNCWNVHQLGTFSFKSKTTY